MKHTPLEPIPPLFGALSEPQFVYLTHRVHVDGVAASCERCVDPFWARSFIGIFVCALLSLGQRRPAFLEDGCHNDGRPRGTFCGVRSVLAWPGPSNMRKRLGGHDFSPGSKDCINRLRSGVDHLRPGPIGTAKPGRKMAAPNCRHLVGLKWRGSSSVSSDPVHPSLRNIFCKPLHTPLSLPRRPTSFGLLKGWRKRPATWPGGSGGPISGRHVLLRKVKTRPSKRAAHEKTSSE